VSKRAEQVIRVRGLKSSTFTGIVFSLDLTFQLCLDLVPTNI
jgi:hypothetical protein